MKKFICILVFLYLISSAAEGIEDRLYKLGYLSESVTVETAIANFQKANGLSCSGIADAETVKLINSNNAISQSEYLLCFYKNDNTSSIIRPGDTGIAVSELQNKLKELKYISDEYTEGVYDDKTIYAVALFEYLNNINIDGVADGCVLARLNSEYVISNTLDKNPFELSVGSYGFLVKSIQISLNELGYYNGAFTGYFGYQTESAIRDFQTANSIVDTGKWNVAQHLLLLSENVIRKDNAALEGSEIALSEGCIDPYVRELETNLKALGYFSSSPDMYFEDDTLQAVMIFQEACGYEITGIADAKACIAARDKNAIQYKEFEQTMSICPISEGDMSFAVYLCTKRLSELGYPLEAKWIYDADVSGVIEKIKKANGITSTGVDSEMRKFINSDAISDYNTLLIVLSEKDLQERRACMYKTAVAVVGYAYEAGKNGPESFSAAGLICYCGEKSGIADKIKPTVSMQLEYAVTLPTFSSDPADISASVQLFYKDGETVLTGICTDCGTVIRASDTAGCVIEIPLSEEIAKYEFIGSVDYFG